MNTVTSTLGVGQQARELLKQLQKRYAAFRDCTPLAIGVDKLLIAAEPSLNRKVLRIALGMHTGSTKYLKEIARGGKRVDLTGHPMDEVTQAQRDHATELLQKRLKDDSGKTALEADIKKAKQQFDEKLDRLATKFSRETKT